MFMKKLYALCLLTLAAIVVEVVLFHPRSATAQSNPTVHVERVLFNPNDLGSRTAHVVGRVVGFHCIDTPGGPQCFIASGNVPASGSSQ
jgi:hypothetical protein